MPIIHLETFVAAPIETIFDLSRDIDAHTRSTMGTDERAIAGVTSGLIGLNDTVTWEARHFGIRQRLTSRIPEFDRPRYFVDEMAEGIFAKIRHEHHFEEVEGGTSMRDIFEFRAPLGVLGRVAEWLFLTRYMRGFLERRNHALKAMAESEAR